MWDQRLRMWFNGWLCDLAPVAAAACGRGRLHVRLLWSCRGRVSVRLVAQFPTRKWRVFSTNSYFRKQQSTTHYVTCLTPKGKHWADCVVGPEHTMLQCAPDRHTEQPYPPLPPPSPAPPSPRVGLERRGASVGTHLWQGLGLGLEFIAKSQL